MQTDFQRREIAIKLVYYGPPHSGKTTNLQKLFERIDPHMRGRLLTLDTRDDRTLYFDLLPIMLRSQGGMTVKFKVYTVPGQALHHATRRLVLQGTDGVAFIADSRVSETRNNNLSYADLKSNLKENGIDPATIPLVIQFNKRDLPGVRSDDELDQLAQRGRQPMFRASAIQGEGVGETFLGLVRHTWAHLEARLQLEQRYGLSGEQLIGQLEEQLFDAGRTP